MKLNVKTLAMLGSATICFTRGTTHEANMINWFRTLFRTIARGEVSGQRDPESLVVVAFKLILLFMSTGPAALDVCRLQGSHERVRSAP